MVAVEIYTCINCKCKRTLAHFGGLEGSSSNWINQTTCIDCKAGRPIGLVWCVIGQHERPRVDFVFPYDSCYICIEARSPDLLRDKTVKCHRSLFCVILKDDIIELMQGCAIKEDLQCKVPRARIQLFFDDIPLIPITNDGNAQRGMDTRQQTNDNGSALVKCAFGHHYKPAECFGSGKKVCKECSQKRRRARGAVDGVQATLEETPILQLDCERPRLSNTIRPSTVPLGAQSARTRLSFDDVPMDHATDPLDMPALTSDDQVLLLNFRKALKKIKMEHCPLCDERWFDTNVKEVRGVYGCEHC